MNDLLEKQSVPRYVKLAEQFSEQIRAGELRPGDRLPSFAEMKASCGVSQNTVERVHGVLEKQGLIIREQGRGTFVALQHETGRRARTGIIGVCGAGFAFRSYQAYWANVFQGIRRVADEAGIQVMVLDHESNAGWEKADGILLSSWKYEPVLAQMPQFLPRVSMLVPIPNVCSVVVDEYNGIRTATEYLLDRGHRRIAFLHSNDHLIVPRRLEGYEDAMRARRLQPDPRWRRQLLSPYIEAQEFVESGRRTMRQWLNRDWAELGCTALLAQNDETAIGAIEVLQETGLRVPADVSVIGFDGTEVCDYFKPRLTSMKVPLNEIGYRATQLLREQIESSYTNCEHEVLPVQIAERDTVADMNTRRQK